MHGIDAIIRNLSPDFTEELKADRINVFYAYELSGLTTEEQKTAFSEYKRSGAISIREARAKKPDAAPPNPPAKEPPTIREEQPKRVEPKPETKKEWKPPEIEPRGAAQQLPPTEQNEPTASRRSEEERTIEQLESLKAYCQGMDESGTDEGSRVWALDVDALECAIVALSGSNADGR